MVNYYKDLEIPRNATPKQIKKAFRKLALKYHPDKNPHKSTKQKFIQIYTAFDVLSNPSKKRKYDRKFDNRKNEKNTTPDFNYNDSSNASTIYEKFKHTILFRTIDSFVNFCHRIIFYSYRIARVCLVLLPVKLLMSIYISYIFVGINPVFFSSPLKFLQFIGNNIIGLLILIIISYLLVKNNLWHIGDHNYNIYAKYIWSRKYWNFTSSKGKLNSNKFFQVWITIGIYFGLGVSIYQKFFN